jgi:signal transduction histidine kinase
MTAAVLSLAVRDVGCGFVTRTAAKTHGMGLLTMRERATAIGGMIRIDSSAAEGTTIEVVMAPPGEAPA